jgi:hypothetical protein
MIACCYFYEFRRVFQQDCEIVILNRLNARKYVIKRSLCVFPWIYFLLMEYMLICYFPKPTHHFWEIHYKYSHPKVELQGTVVAMWRRYLKIPKWDEIFTFLSSTWDTEIRKIMATTYYTFKCKVPYLYSGHSVIMENPDFNGKSCRGGIGKEQE